MKPGDDLPKDLTFNDPLITGRPHNLPARVEPRPEPPAKAHHRLRELLIGLILLGAFLAAIWAVSKVPMTHR